MTKENRFLCDFPWIHLSTFPQGNCTVCCVAKHSGQDNGHSWNKPIVGKNINLTVMKNSLDEIVNCDNYRSIRRDMLDGKIPVACEGCYKVEQVGGKSKRIMETTRGLDFDALTKEDGSIKVDLRHIELRLGNYCNLKCRTCNADSSTSWIKDYYKLKDTVNLASGYDWIKNNPDFSFDWVDDENFYNSLIEAAPNLEQIHISGGEPFLVPMHFKLLERLVNDGKTDIAIHYHTNLNYKFDKIKHALDLLTNFREVHISFSIDDVGERNTYIRSLSDWNLMLNNLNLITANYNFIFRITQTISVYNFLYVEELEQTLQRMGIDVRVSLNHVHNPTYLDANVLPKQVRQDKINSIHGKVSHRIWQDLYGQYYNAEENDQWDYFKYFTEKLDDVRKENLKKYFGRLIELY